MASYLKLKESGELERRGRLLWAIMKNCRLCPRNCHVNRLKGERGTCGASSELEISSFNPHFGEEPPLVGSHGSGTIFFTHCGLRCIFCINGEISIGGIGTAFGKADLALMMLHLQKKGCHNINLVSPTHYLPHIIMALDLAAGQGLNLPLVYNTSGYEHTEILKMLDGIVDIYLPDFKYYDSKMAGKYSPGAGNYPIYAKKALLEMHRQVGVAIPGKNGIMQRGLMIRHLLMPGKISGTKDILKWISENLPKNTYINLMSQYRPMHEAFKYPELSVTVSARYYSAAIDCARSLGLSNVEIQGF